MAGLMTPNVRHERPLPRRSMEGLDAMPPCDERDTNREQQA